MIRALLPVAAALMLGFGATPAFAQTRVFVSGTGSDSNPCSLSAPCRSFQKAHDTVVAGGEIVALDAAGYGPLAISKAVTVTAIGIEASITSNSSSGGAIQINAGSSDVVAIRGVTVIAGTQNHDGIDIDAAKSVTIRDTSISGFSGSGISVNTTGGSLDLELHGVTSTNNSQEGLKIFPIGPAAVTTVAVDSDFTGNGDTGVFMGGPIPSTTITATLNISAAANGSDGILVDAGNATMVVMVTGSKLVNNAGRGLAGTNAISATVYVDRTQITGNGGMGWQATGGAVVKSYTNNEVNGNGSDALNGVVQISSE